MSSQTASFYLHRYLPNVAICAGVGAFLIYVVGAPSVIAGLVGFMAVGAFQSCRRPISG